MLPLKILGKFKNGKSHVLGTLQSRAGLDRPEGESDEGRLRASWKKNEVTFDGGSISLVT